ncbi:hypothetical protein ACFX5U_11140 [Sphingobacterium sp. SG20118]
MISIFEDDAEKFFESEVTAWKKPLISALSPDHKVDRTKICDENLLLN